MNRAEGGHLDAQGVANAAQVLQVGAVQLPGALTAPQEVAGAAVPEACGTVLAGQCLPAPSQTSEDCYDCGIV